MFSDISVTFFCCDETTSLICLTNIKKQKSEAGKETTVLLLIK